ncbi:alpha/beta fold hydrolase [Kribbella sp. HUAS MG21]|uniref:Alpha/beta fold hydrolase n=1 Tax=Kribbella sp. HUAS MG21 TaxID=3160966 RepID=A0AAU7T509_9ACTN
MVERIKVTFDSEGTTCAGYLHLPAERSANPAKQNSGPAGRSAGPAEQDSGPAGRSAGPAGQNSDAAGRNSGPAGRSAGPPGRSADPAARTAGPAEQDADTAGRNSALTATSASGRVACVVLCHGFSGTMDRLFSHAERFAAAGMAALVFDYRSFGESGGEPRQVADVVGQQQDLRAAVAFARRQEYVDPDAIVLWGNSLGGAHVITVAADDPDVVAVVAQIPFNGFPKRVEGRSTWETLRLLSAIGWDAVRGKLGLPPYYVPMIGRPGQLAVAATDEADQHIQALTSGEATTLWRNSIAPRALLGMMRYRPEEDAARLTVPLLVCVAADDHETPIETNRALADRAPAGELRSYPGTHFSFYTDEAVREHVLDDQIAFIHRSLQLRSAQPRVL